MMHSDSRHQFLVPMPKAKVSWLLCIGRLVSKTDNVMHFAHLVEQASVTRFCDLYVYYRLGCDLFVHGAYINPLLPLGSTKIIFNTYGNPAVLPSSLRWFYRGTWQHLRHTSLLRHREHNPRTFPRVCNCTIELCYHINGSLPPWMKNTHFWLVHK